jgi:hypothetical protein
MLFIHNLHDGLEAGMSKLISDGLVIKEGPRNAYCLTESGFAAVRSI